MLGVFAEFETNLRRERQLEGIAKRSFRMGVAGWRFAHGKRISGRAAVVAVLEELPGICSLAVAAGSMIMIGIMLYKDWPQ